MRIYEPSKAPCDTANARRNKWAGEDSNLRPTDYESAALTAELPAPMVVAKASEQGLDADLGTSQRHEVRCLHVDHLPPAAPCTLGLVLTHVRAGAADEGAGQRCRPPASPAHAPRTRTGASARAGSSTPDRPARRRAAARARRRARRRRHGGQPRSSAGRIENRLSPSSGTYPSSTIRRCTLPEHISASGGNTIPP